MKGIVFNLFEGNGLGEALGSPPWEDFDRATVGDLLTEMERVYGVWALGPKIELEWVWGEYTDGGPEWGLRFIATFLFPR